MSVLKSKRQESQFEVFHHYYVLRREVTNLTTRDFGFSIEKAQKRLDHWFRDRPYEELDDSEKERYDKLKAKYEAFDEWFVDNEREAILDMFRNLGRCLFHANSIYPQYMEELTQRRLLQDEALGWCESLKQEEQYVIETLPVDINKYDRFADLIDAQIRLIKGWRKADNKFKKIISTAQAG